MTTLKSLFLAVFLAVGSSLLTSGPALANHLPTALLAVQPSSGGSAGSADTANACGDDEIELGFPLLNGERCLDKNAPGGPIFAYVRMLITLLSGAVGITVVLLLVIGGFQHITSAGDPTQVKSAKNRITNAITGLVLFILMFAILNYLIPGGVIGSGS